MEDSNGLFVLKGPVGSDQAKDGGFQHHSRKIGGQVTQSGVRERGSPGALPSEPSIASLVEALKARESKVVLGANDLSSSGAGFRVATEVFPNGLSEVESSRRAALSSRPLLPTDIPRVTWVNTFSNYWLREDGALIRVGQSIEFGWLDGHGGVVWTDC